MQSTPERQRTTEHLTAAEFKKFKQVVESNRPKYLYAKKIGIASNTLKELLYRGSASPATIAIVRSIINP
jgi:hypothetical protein